MAETKIYPHELIGEEVEVVNSTNSSHIGIKGKIVDETKSTIKIEQQGKIKTLLKNNVSLRLTHKGKIIEGQSLMKRPEDRIKGK